MQLKKDKTILKIGNLNLEEIKQFRSTVLAEYIAKNLYSITHISLRDPKDGSVLLKILSAYDEIRNKKHEDIAAIIISQNIGCSLTMLTEIIQKLEVTITEDSKGLLTLMNEIYNTRYNIRAQSILKAYQENDRFFKMLEIDPNYRDPGVGNKHSSI